MPLGSESNSVQRPFVRYAVEAGWTFLSPDDALALRNGGVTSPVLDNVFVAQLLKLNPKVLNAAKAADVVKRLVRLRPTIEGNLNAWEFLRGPKTVFAEAEKRERNVRFMDAANVSANVFQVTEEFTFSNGIAPDMRADIVFFINGVPVLIVETKKASATRPLARGTFQAEVEAWAKRIHVQPKVVHVRPMKRKWGSCSTSGRVSFDTTLLCQHAEFRRRVIVEELLHLRIPNHGMLFKAMLAAYLKRKP